MQTEEDCKVHITEANNDSHDDQKMRKIIPLAVSVQDISDHSREETTLIRKSDRRENLSRIPTPKFHFGSKKSSLKASFSESHGYDMSSSLGKQRELPDDNVLDSS